MSLQTITWLFTAALCLEQIERYIMYRRGWSGSVGEPITLIKFLFGLALVAVCGAYFAINAPMSPDVAFGGATALLVGLIVVQIAPRSGLARWRYVPGLVSELLLLCPLAIAVIYRSITADALTVHGLFLVSGPLIGSLLGVWWAVKKPSLPAMPPGPFGD